MWQVEWVDAQGEREIRKISLASRCLVTTSERDKKYFDYPVEVCKKENVSYDMESATLQKDQVQATLPSL
jgi:hypothetical protein